MIFEEYISNNTTDSRARYILATLPKGQGYRNLETHYAAIGLLNTFLDLWNAYSEELDRRRYDS